MFPAGNILGELCAFSGLFRKKIPKEAIIRLKAGLSLVRLGRLIFSNATAPSAIIHTLKSDSVSNPFGFYEIYDFDFQ